MSKWAKKVENINSGDTVDVLNKTLSPENKLRLMPSPGDVNTSQLQQSDAFMKLLRMLNPLNNEEGTKKERFAYGVYDGLNNKNNYDLIKKGMIPNKQYFTRFNFYLDSIIHYFIEKINVESSKLTYDQWQTAYTAMYNLFYFGKVLVRYDAKNKCYNTKLPVVIELDDNALFKKGTAINIGAINNMYGYVQGSETYKAQPVQKEEYVLSTISKWGLGFLYTLREDILTSIYFERKIENVALLESVKAYETVGDVTTEGYFENQVKQEDKPIIRKAGLANNAIGDKLEIIDYKTGEKLQSLTGYMDWRDSRIATWVGYIENQTKNKKSNLIVAEVEGTQDLQENRFEHYYDVVRKMFIRIKEMYPESPIELKEYKELEKEINEGEEENVKIVGGGLQNK